MNKTKIYGSPISLTSQFYFCPVPLRLDTYSGCSHNCLYCFANNSNQKYIINPDMLEKATSIKNFEVKPTSLKIIKSYLNVAFNNKPNRFSNQEAIAVELLKRKVPLHFGGMSDPLQPIEEKYNLTYDTLTLLKSYNYPVIFSTKGKLLLTEKYYKLIKDYENFALQISLIDDRQEVLDILEPTASSVEERLKMFEIYQDKWTACRIQPFIVGLSESRIIPILDKLKERGVNHVMVEGMKFFSSNKLANKKIGEAFKKITGNSYDLEAYFRAIGAKYSGNDIELPSWRKYRYIKIFKEETKKRGITLGVADNDLRFLGDSFCCCGVEKLKGFEGYLRHNTGFALFKALQDGVKTFNQELIAKEFFPEGKFRLPMSNKEAVKRYGAVGENNRDIRTLFEEAWKSGEKNSPCMYCNIKHLGSGNYKFLNHQELDEVLRFRGNQQNLLKGGVK